MTNDTGSESRLTASHVLPPLMLSSPDRERLIDLASAALGRMPSVAELLLDEVERATAVPPGELPAGVVRIGSYVEYRDEESGEHRCVQIVYPAEADIAQWKISVLTLIGSGLIGLAEGQAIAWPTRQGHVRLLTVLRVRDQPFPREPSDD